MTPRPDDDALSWSGDDDPTLDVGTPGAIERADEIDESETAMDAAPVALPKGYTAVGQGSADVGRIEADGSVVMPGDREPMSNAALIALGVFGGVYLLYVIGWIIGGLRLEFFAVAAVAAPAYYASLLFAVLAPILWFATTYLLTRRSKAWLRIVWYLAGVVLLVPWPFLMVGMVGQ
ncbi:DNA polymerase III subunit gamma/tau [Microbacterium sp.]|uniref:DNA polymerase III subunit gamma/tau n=1 Tax=Microbacterium sp. TaxID=51671 RepID=UPI003F71548B